jgi:hypothetical protein
MKPRHEEKWTAIRRLRRRGLPLALIAGSFILLQASECKKGREFYTPVGLTSGVNDNTPPLITSFLPAPNVTLNDVFVMATITDPEGTNGAASSGVDPASITATGDDGADLPITMAGTNMYNADIADWGDGPHSIDWSALDFAGNEGTGSQTITIDRTDPVVTTSPTPPATATSDDTSFSWTVGFNIVEPHFLEATYRVTFPGPDDDCGTGDDVTPTAEQVPTSTFDLDEGANTVEVAANNPVAPGGQAMTLVYCGAATARDDAVTKSGGEASNTTTTTQYRTELTWQPSLSLGFNITLGNPVPGYCHIAQGDTRTYTGIGTDPNQMGAPYSISWTGPGTVGGTTRSGVLDASGNAFDEQMINQFGTYTVMTSVTVGGNTEMATGTVNVTAAQGACQQISSIRFKRGVVALLPDDARPLGLNPVAFRYVEPYGDPAVPRIGLIAEEVAEVFPHAVLSDAEGQPYAIDYRVLTIGVIEEVEARVVAAAKAAIGRLAGPY